MDEVADDSDSEALTRTIRRRGRTALLIAAVAALGTYGLMSTVPPLYRAQAVVELDWKPDTASAQRRHETLQAIESLRAQATVADISRSLDLADRPEFSLGSEGTLQRIAAQLDVVPAPPALVRSHAQVIEDIRDRIGIERLGRGRIAIRFTSESPEIAAAVANALTDAFVDGRSAHDGYSGQRARLQSRLADAEAQLRDLGSAAKTLPVAQAGADRQPETTGRAERIAAALKSGDPSDISDAVDTPDIDALAARERTVDAQLRDLSQTLLDRHPRIIQLKAAREAAHRALLQAAHAALSQARASESADAITTGSIPVPAPSADAHADAHRARLLADIDLVKDQIAALAVSSANAAETAAPDARTVARATPPRHPYRPKTFSIVLVSATTVLCLAIVWALFAELRAHRRVEETEDTAAEPESVADPDLDSAVDAAIDTEIAAPEIDEAADDPVVAEIPAEPQSETSEPAAALADAEPLDVQAETEAEAPPAIEQSDRDRDFSISAAVVDILESDGGRVVCISPEGAAGVAVSVTLARLVAEQGVRTVLLDLTGTGTVNALMEAPGDLPGVTDMLAGAVEAAETIHFDADSPVHFVPRGASDPVITPEAAEDLGRFIEALENAYEVVVIECGASEPETAAELVDPANGRLIVTAVEPDEAEITETLAGFYAAGFDRLRVMMPWLPYDPKDGREAAA